MQYPCANLDEYHAWIEEAIIRFSALDVPMGVSPTYEPEDEIHPESETRLYGRMLFCLYDHTNLIDTVRADFPIGDTIFDDANVARQRLLDAGRMVKRHGEHDELSGTFLITLSHGVWADTKKPAYLDFWVNLPEEEAFILALRYGGRMRPVK